MMEMIHPMVMLKSLKDTVEKREERRVVSYSKGGCVMTKKRNPSPL